MKRFVLVSLFLLAALLTSVAQAQAPAQTQPATARAAAPSQAVQSQPAPAGSRTETNASLLTNKDVLDMLKAGLTPGIVIAKIKSSACSFGTSPVALKGLKAAKVPDAVILAMVKAPVAAPTRPANPTLPVQPPPDSGHPAYANCEAGCKVYANTTQSDFSTVATLRPNEKIEMLSEENGWYKIRTSEGKEGYVKNQPSPTPVASQSVSEVRTPTQQEQATSSAPERVLRIASVSCINATEIPISPSPGASSSVASLRCGEKISVLDKQGYWDKVRTEDGKEGYVPNWFVSLSPPQGASSQSQTLPPVPTPPPQKDSKEYPLSVEVLSYSINSAVVGRTAGSATTDCQDTGPIGGLGGMRCSTTSQAGRDIRRQFLYIEATVDGAPVTVGCAANLFRTCRTLEPGSYSGRWKGNRLVILAYDGKGKSKESAYNVYASGQR